MIETVTTCHAPMWAFEAAARASVTRHAVSALVLTMSVTPGRYLRAQETGGPSIVAASTTPQETVDGGTRGPVAAETVRAFVTHVEESASLPAEAKAFVGRMWKERMEEGDVESFLAEALAVVSEGFRSGLEAYEEGEYGRAHEIMNGLAGDDDPYVSANAAAMAVKALIEQGMIVEARAALEAFVADPTAVDLYTVSGAEMAYLRGFCALQDLEYRQSGEYLQEMLKRYPEAGARLRVGAEQILAELRRREPEKLGDVADLMGYSGRRLALLDTGERVKERQQRAIDLLDKLIEEAEQNEQSSSSGGGSSSGQNDGKSPSNPMPDSQLPGGGGAPENLRTARRAKPGEMWGNMRPEERQKILQLLHDSFPSRYRQLVEQYYEELSKQP